MLCLIDNEPIIHRTSRLAKSYSDVVIVAKDNDYQNEFSDIYIPNLSQEFLDCDKFLSSRSLWNNSGRTVILYGDCFFTNQAIKTIMEYKEKDWTFFYRFGGSKLTGCKYGEIFAFSFMPSQHENIEQKLMWLAGLGETKQVWRTGGWEAYRVLSGAKTVFDIERHAEYRNFVSINDWTEDFDLPEDYDNWTKNYHMI